jgi:hypothetical protein
MNLCKSRRPSGRTYLSITQRYREGGRQKTRTIESLGYVDELEKRYLDPIAHFQNVVKEMNEERKAKTAPIILAFSPLKKIDMKAAGSQKELGCAVLSFYYHLLRIDRFWDNRRMRNNFKYNPNAIFKLVVYERIVRPGSKAAAYANKDRYLDRMDFTYDDMMRCLSFFTPYKDDLIAWVNERIATTHGRDTSRSYYDVTNYYFEIEAEDALRKKGVSKEKRKSPIIQMGLLMDAGGIPLTYDLYPGNTNDCETLLPILKEAKRRYGLGRTIVVADRGLNTSDNIAANIVDGNGYVFSQSVRKGDKALKKWVLDPSGYCGNDEFRIKSVQADKTVYITDDEGKTVKVDVPIKRVAFWSADYAERSKHEREAVLKKSAKLISDAAAFEHTKGYGAGRYVCERTVDVGTGEIKKTVRTLDEAKIAEDSRYDGYYCIITSETGLADEEIIEIYRGLWRIEETFRITKSDLCARPVFVSLEEHIKAHFLTCYIALLLLRLIQADTGFKYSAAKIAEAIRNITGTHMKENCYLFGYRTDLTDELGRLIGQELNRQVYTVGAMKDILAETKKAGR